MSMQIIYGKVVNSEVVFEKGNRGVNLTEVLKKVCCDFFVEKNIWRTPKKFLIKRWIMML